MASTIIYCAIGVGGSLVCDYAVRAGNFAAQVPKLLKRSGPPRASYNSEQYMFHVQCRNNVVVLCISEMGYKQALAFKFLDKVSETFFSKYSEAQRSPVMQVRSFSADLKKDVDYFNSPEADKLAQLKSEIEAVKGVMTESIDRILERGEKIDILVNRTEDLATEGEHFFHQSRDLRKRMWWKNVKLAVMITIIVLFVIFLLVVFFCGGFTFKKCKSNG